MHKRFKPDIAPDLKHQLFGCASAASYKTPLVLTRKRAQQASRFISAFLDLTPLEQMACTRMQKPQQ